MSTDIFCDVLVVGGGNAGFCAALAAAQAKAGKVLLIDKCPKEWGGGNSYFTAGAFRTVHGGLEDVLPLVNNVNSTTIEAVDLDPYTRDDFLGDLDRVTHGQYDHGLGRELVDGSNGAVKWLAKTGIAFQLSFNRQAYKVHDRYKFFGGICLKTQDGGEGLVKSLQKAADDHDIEVMYSTSATKINLNLKTGELDSVLADQVDKSVLIQTKAVVLAAGGFEANPQMRSKHLGPGWENAHVRGTPYNTGGCLEMAIRDISARRKGHWAGCHAVAWDANAPQESGDRKVSNEFTKSGYPIGITINVEGKRFFDEGSDLRNYTYAKFGRAILAQPNSIAFQVWDSKGIPWLREEEYRPEVVERIEADSIEELAQKCAEQGLADPDMFIDTIREYNAAVSQHRKDKPDTEWDPAILDGLSTQSATYQLSIPKSNWALSIDEGPFLAVKVGCGVTFTFGGLEVDPKTAGIISDATGKSVPGVFCAGEMVGGLFYENYPGGSGLTSGAVFGLKAGKNAAQFALQYQRRRHAKSVGHLGIALGIVTEYSFVEVEL
ncbi:hypothetical protein BGZ60DRAFT_555254 [Tricladium varicosporioides]|nr:hypothetical protein BGZ60DRAFT_555254 [Hymenoscyphus varicosporioides]